LDEGKVVGCKLVVACRDPPTSLDPIKEPSDPVTGAVEIRAEADRIVAIASRWDVDPSAFLHGKLSDPIGVASSIDPDFKRDRSSRRLPAASERSGCSKWCKDQTLPVDRAGVLRISRPRRCH
jgi:hypothetical protein